MKKILAIILTLAVFLSFAALAISCGEDTPEVPDAGNNNDNGNNNNGEQNGEDYTLTIRDINGAPIENITVKFKYGDESTVAMTSGADGKITANIDTREDVVVVFENTGSYGTPEARDSKFKTNELTIVMPQMVTVKVVDSEGNAVEGVVIQICHSVCLLPIATDANGEVNKGIIPKDRLKVSINEVPDGYAIPEAIDTAMDLPIHAYFEEGVYTVTITIPNA